jgi:adenosine kinase
MLRHTEECRSRGYAFAADPSQQLAFADGPFIRRLIEGATWLFTNEYEASLTEQKTGWSADDILERVGTRVTTLGSRGVRVERLGEPAIEVPVAKELRIADPTGVGDAFRAGFLAGLSWDLPPRRCAEVGSMLATYVIETVGTQEYEIARGGFLERFADAYGDEAAAEVRPHLGLVRA